MTIVMIMIIIMIIIIIVSGLIVGRRGWVHNARAVAPQSKVDGFVCLCIVCVHVYVDLFLVEAGGIALEYGGIISCYHFSLI